MEIDTKISFCNGKVKFWWKSVTIANVNNLLEMTVSEKDAKKTQKTQTQRKVTKTV